VLVSTIGTAFAKVNRYLATVRRRNKLIAYWCVRLVKSPPPFTFQGETYTQFWHRYNSTWRNERAVEIPIIRAVVRKSPGARILEVGNVLSHYGPVSHDVIDKYEKAEGVVNEDICNYAPVKRYDLILSLSTLEHIGWDEQPRRPEKILHAFENLKCLLAPGGRILVTLPLGYNGPMDQWLREGKIAFTRQFYLKRISPANVWREVGWNHVQNARYDDSVPTARELLIGIVEKT
jgi:SAM-dependent methyltransferase